MQIQGLDLMGLAKPGEICGLTGAAPVLDLPEAAGLVFGRFWNRTEPFLHSKRGPLAGYADPLLTLYSIHTFVSVATASACHTVAVAPIHWCPSHTQVAYIWQTKQNVVSGTLVTVVQTQNR